MLSKKAMKVNTWAPNGLGIRCAFVLCARAYSDYLCLDHETEAETVIVDSQSRADLGTVTDGQPYLLGSGLDLEGQCVRSQKHQPLALHHW